MVHNAISECVYLCTYLWICSDIYNIIYRLGNPVPKRMP